MNDESESIQEPSGEGQENKWQPVRAMVGRRSSDKLNAEMNEGLHKLNQSYFNRIALLLKIKDDQAALVLKYAGELQDAGNMIVNLQNHCRRLADELERERNKKSRFFLIRRLLSVFSGTKKHE